MCSVDAVKLSHLLSFRLRAADWEFIPVHHQGDVRVIFAFANTALNKFSILQLDHVILECAVRMSPLEL